MKWLAFPLLILTMVSCSRVVVVNLGERMPQPAFIQGQDNDFLEGWEWLQKGNPDRAIKCFQLSRAPLEKKHVAFAYSFLAKNKIGLAREQFEKSLALSAENIEAEIGLAVTFELNNERENAFHVYSRLMAKYPEEPRVRNKYLEIKTTATQEFLAEAIKEKSAGREEKYIHDLEQASYYSPETIAIEREIADFYFQKSKWDEALQHYQNLLVKDAQNIELLARIAEIYENTRRFDRALLILDQALAIQPGNPALDSKRRQIREKFLMLNLPQKFKDIFFKSEVNREDLAALIGHYFQDYVNIEQAPVILTDIDTSYAREEIIRISSSGIIKERPNHTFDRFSLPDRASFAEILNTLIAFLEKRGHSFLFAPKENVQSPTDISPEHKNWGIITFLIQSQIISLDREGNFNPTATLSPSEVVSALQKILNGMLK